MPHSQCKIHWNNTAHSKSQTRSQVVYVFFGLELAVSQANTALLTGKEDCHYYSLQNISQIIFQIQCLACCKKCPNTKKNRFYECKSEKNKETKKQINKDLMVENASELQ